MKNKQSKGFTLVELIVVIAIIGTLAAIIIPSLISFVREARITAAIADARTVKAVMEDSLVKHIMLNGEDADDGFNKVIFYDNDTSKNWKDRDYELVGAFSNISWYKYKKNNLGGGKSQQRDRIIAGALDNAFSEKWETGSGEKNALAYNTNTQNCKKYLKDYKTNFCIIIVYDTGGTVRFMQLYRKGILVTFAGGDFIANTSSTAHFVGTQTWNTIYTDAGETSPDRLYRTSLSNQQLNDARTSLGGWY